MTKTPLLLVIALGITVTLAIALGITTTSATDHAGLDRFEHRAIAWHTCQTGPGDQAGAQLDAVGAKCGTVTVPLDYRDPGGRTISVAVAWRPATDAARRLGTLVVNTGGPGPSLDGVTVIAKGDPGLAPHGAPALAARYNLVGIDPRFFGLSTPLECGWPTDLALHFTQFATPDRRSFDASVTISRNLASRCAKYAGRLPFASTRDIARDMDLVRAALGVQKISYLGWSYGTYLGAVYLQMFPSRVNRIVLDSALDPNTYGPGLTRNLAPADAAALRDWAGWAARRDGHYGLGDTADAVLDTVHRIIDVATRHPLQVGGYKIDATMLPGMLLTVEDTDAAYAEFTAKVRVLRDAANGLPATPTGDYKALLALYADPNVLPQLNVSATTANQCADRAASRDPETYYRDIQDHLAAEPFYGPLFRHITPCAFWPISPIERPTTISNDHPALIVGATGDPAAPYPGQLVMHQALRGSRMIALDNAFQHGVFLEAGNTCVDATVENYLLAGALPSRDLTCHRAGPRPPRTR
jgi:pimeloyl-ACP methyl ester carboxylesterase